MQRVRIGLLALALGWHGPAWADPAHVDPAKDEQTADRIAQKPVPGAEPNAKPRSPVQSLAALTTQSGGPPVSFGDASHLTSPLEASRILAGEQDRAAKRCRRRDRDCDLPERLQSALQLLARNTRQNELCQQSIAELDKVRRSAPVSQWAAYDRHCLATFADESGKPVPVATDLVLGRADQHVSLLSNLGVSLRDGQVACAGLLTDQGEFFTANHCVEQFGSSPGQVMQVSTGRVWDMELIARGIPPTHDDESVTSIRSWEKFAAHDWARYFLTLDNTYRASAVDFVGLDPRQPLAILAANPHQLVDAGAGTPMGDVGRVSYDGSCASPYHNKNCIQIYCQIMFGFSGAPVFQRPDPDAPVRYVGMLHGANTTESQGTCALRALPGSGVVVPFHPDRNIR